MENEFEGVIEVKDHLEKEHEDECGYCGQVFGPDFVVIEKTLHGRKWKFCSEECYRDFKDAADFKDQDLDSEESALPPTSEEDEANENEEGKDEF